MLKDWQLIYQYIGLKGSATWDAETYQIIKFKFNSVVSYNGGTTFNAINEIKNNITSDIWDNYNLKMK